MLEWTDKRSRRGGRRREEEYTVKDSMSKRERVEATLNLQPTDRPPIYDIILHDELIRYVAGGTPGATDEWWRRRIQATAKLVDMTRMVAHRPQSPGEKEDAEGFVHYSDDLWIMGGIRKRPFSDLAGAKEWLGRNIEKLRPPFDVDAYREGFARYWEEARAVLEDDTVIIHEYGTGLDAIRYMLGWEFFSYLSVDEPEMISEYLELYTDMSVAQIHAVEDGERTPCALPFGDIAAKNMLLHSPEWLRKEFFPRVKRLCDALHEHDVKGLFHSDGDLMPVLDDIAAAGCDGINPIETVAGMDLAEVKRQYGDRFFLTGAIDISQLLPYASVDEVRAVVRENIQVASPGYFPGSTTELDNSARLDNAMAVFEEILGRPVPKAVG